MFIEHKVMVFQVHRIGCVWKTPFRKSSHICCYQNVSTKHSSTCVRTCIYHTQEGEVVITC